MQDNFSEGNIRQTGQSGEKEEHSPALTCTQLCLRHNFFPQAVGIDNTDFQRVNSRNN